MANIVLNKREKKLMEFLWENDGGFTSNELLLQLGEKDWNKLSMYRTLNRLNKIGYIKVIGFEQYNTQYARKFTYAITPEEYAAKLLAIEGMRIDSLTDIACAFVRESSGTQSDRQLLIDSLQSVIDNLKQEDEL